jgi:hypothetical protein
MAVLEGRPIKSNLNPNAPGNLVILNSNRVHFLRLLRLLVRS